MNESACWLDKKTPQLSSEWFFEQWTSVSRNQTNCSGSDPQLEKQFWLQFFHLRSPAQLASGTCAKLFQRFCSIGEKKKETPLRVHACARGCPAERLRFLLQCRTSGIQTTSSIPARVVATARSEAAVFVLCLGFQVLTPAGVVPNAGRKLSEAHVILKF